VRGVRILPVPPKKKSKAAKVGLWMAGVVFALLPLGLIYVNGRLDHKPTSWIELLAGGELFLISAAVAADAVGGALLGGERYRGLRFICGLSCSLLVAATSAYFARIAYSLQQHQSLLEMAVKSQNFAQASQLLTSPGMDQSVIATDSSWLFLFTICAALGVILVEED
jgi:MFS family permease